MKEQLNLFLDSSQQFLNEIAISLPRILGAILILLIGWIIARLIRRGLVKLLHLVKFNFLTEKSGIDKFLKEGGAKKDSIGIIGTLVYWLLMLIVIIATLNSLNLTVASDLFNEMMMYLPNILVAIVILIIGIYLARMVSQVAKTSLKSMKEKTSSLIGQITYASIIVLTVFVTLGQLNIASEIVTSAFIILFGAICLALALAFGLGGREKAAGFLDDMAKRQEKE
jgi:membrane-associated HD superfamily phosphohydrolase